MPKTRSKSKEEEIAKSSPRGSKSPKSSGSPNVLHESMLKSPTSNKSGMRKKSSSYSLDESDLSDNNDLFLSPFSTTKHVNRGHGSFGDYSDNSDLSRNSLGDHSFNASGDSFQDHSYSGKKYKRQTFLTPDRKFSPRHLSRSPANQRTSSTEETYDGLSNKFLIAIVVIVLAIIIALKNFDFGQSVEPRNSRTVSTQTPIKDMKQVLNSFTVKLEHIKHEFPNQDRYFWASISAPVKHIITNENPRQPAVIMFAAHPDHRDVASELARDLASAIVDAYETFLPPIMINATKEIKPYPAAEAKYRLDTELNSMLKKGGVASNIYELQDLPGEAAMILHSYCDNDNAPFKKVVHIFTATVPTLETSADHLISERITEDFLRRQWKPTLGVDNTTALLSRLTPNVCPVKSEDLN